MEFGKKKEDEQPEEKPMTNKEMLEMMVNFAKELKKPSEEEQAEKDRERQRMLENQQNSIAEAKREAQQKEANHNACSHMKPHPYTGKTRIRAQMHSDGLYHPICLNCQKEFLPFPAGGDTIPVGNSLDDYSGITPQIIDSWGKRHAERQKVLAGV